MLRRIFVAIGVSVMVLGGILPAHTNDRDKDDDGNKKGHRAILNAVTGGTNSSNAGHTTLQGEHAAQNADHSALSQQISSLPTGAGVGRCDVPPVWGAQITTGRFVSVFGGAAYCDQESGLVWEQSPGETNGINGVDLDDRLSWADARGTCANKNVGGRKGWRLASVEELASLVDPANSSPALPMGHPFTIDQSFFNYWSATTDVELSTNAWFVRFQDGAVLAGTKGLNRHVWCVRGDGPLSEY